MHFQRFYLDCLAHASYAVGDGDEIAIIDPRRDTEIYEDYAAEHGAKITLVLLTHHHADFVGGHLELADRTGADVVISATAQAQFPHLAVRSGDLLRVGSLSLEVLETPGHTPESVCYWLKESSHGGMLFTGDTLFINEVGRPDLLGASLSAETLANQLYDSLHGTLAQVPDDTHVYPAHGAGSSCGRNISDAATDTLGNQRHANYALQTKDRARFVELVTAELPPAPLYFAHNAKLNRVGPPLERQADHLMALTAVDFDQIRQDDQVVWLDVRDAVSFAEGHLVGSLNVPLDGQFASWVGTVIPFEAKLVLITPPDRRDEALTRLRRTGYDTVLGYLTGGPDEWAREGLESQRSKRMALTDWNRENETTWTVIDVRKPTELAGPAIVAHAKNIPLADLRSRLDELPDQGNILVHCAGGYRSAIAASMIRAAKPKANVQDLLGGYNAWQSAVSAA